MSFMGDYITAYHIWRGLTKAQQKALLFPWADPHPRVEAALVAKGLWKDDGPTRAGLAVALCRFIATKPRRPVATERSP